MEKTYVGEKARTIGKMIERMKKERGFIFSVANKDEYEFHTVPQRNGTVWVYAEPNHRYIGWMRDVRGKLSIVRGKDVGDDELVTIKVFQYVLDAANDESKAERFSVEIAPGCAFCGRPLPRGFRAGGYCQHCKTSGYNA